MKFAYLAIFAAAATAAPVKQVVRDFLSNTAAAAGAAAGNVVQAVGGAVDSVGGAVEGTGYQVEDYAAGRADLAGAADLGGLVGGAVEDAGKIVEDAGDAVDNVGSTVKEVTKDTGL